MGRIRNRAPSLEVISLNPKRGEIWWVAPDITVGEEIQKKRPAVVVSSDGLSSLKLRLVAPITGWQDALAGKAWHVSIQPSTMNGLTKPSSVDTFQLRGTSLDRFLERIGTVDADTMEEITAAIAVVIEYR
jgi:mRNA interferase MazF